MADGRRHSVDMPISKALVALKRVRSLRDPDTNSTTKFATVVENMNWDVNSCNGAFLDFGNNPPRHHHPHHRHNHHHHVSRSRAYHAKGGTNDLKDDSESDGSSRKPVTKLANFNNSSLDLYSYPDQARKILESCRGRARNSSSATCVPYSTNLLEEETDSYSGQNFELDERANARVTSKKLEDATMSRIGSPCMSMGDARTIASSRSTLGLPAEEVDVVDGNFNGCGIGYCWSRTPRYRDPNLASDVEDQEHPLLLAEGRESDTTDVTPYIESPRNLSQKFRPKTFNDLVGLNTVAKSLLYAVSKGKVAPMYLFHGPRGTGKTSTARIFAAFLNCLSLEEHRPCGFCRECLFLFSGKSRDVKELESVKINRKDMVKSLLKSASRVPSSSRFKVFIIDECHFLRGETWAAILSSIEEVSRHAVFVMITSDPDKMPHSCFSQCQRYYFPKIKEADTISRLKNICVEEGLEFDIDALEFIALKSDGSLRDAETMLDQLALLGKRITVTLAYELVGVVSDDELLDLLDLALSTETANTVRRARELMSSRVDPMQLTSQLADIIMDILSGRRQSGSLEAGGKFFGRHALANAGLHKLRHALKILSETEKQLRTSKNQATWLTVALLQFSTHESSSPIDVIDSKEFRRDNLCPDIGSTRESLDKSVCYICSDKSNCSERHCDRNKLEAIWRKTIRKCQSSSLKSFLLKEGRLSAVYVNEGLVTADVEFYHPDHISRAEKSWKLIADALQHVLGCNVEVRLKLVPTSKRKLAKVKKLSFSLLNCSGKNRGMLDSNMTDESESETYVRREASDDAFPPQCGQPFSPFTKTINRSRSFHDKTVTIKVKDARTSTSEKSFQGDIPIGCRSESNFSQGVSEGPPHFNPQESENQPNCFAKTLKLQRRFLSADIAHTICLRIQPHNKLEVSIPKKEAFETYFCTHDPYNFCSRSNTQLSESPGEENVLNEGSRFSSKLLCWKAPRSSCRKTF